jgi:hypothetical protein
MSIQLVAKGVYVEDYPFSLLWVQDTFILHKAGKPSLDTDKTNSEEVILGLKSVTEIGRLHLVHVPPRADKPAV